MSVWVPKSAHVSQLQYNQITGGLDGRDDCGPACLVRYLREAGKLPIDIAVTAQLNELREIFSGLPDVPGQGGTSVTDLERALAHFGLTGKWTGNFAEAQAQQMSVVLVDSGPMPSQYPASWLGSQDHWILWLPQLNGAANWFNDPLAYSQGQKDCQYSIDSVRGNFLGAILLPDLPHLTSVNKYYTTKMQVGLKVQANHVCSSLAIIPASTPVLSLGTGTVVDTEAWSRVQFEGKPGWIPTLKLSGVVQ